MINRHNPAATQTDEFDTSTSFTQPDDVYASLWNDLMSEPAAVTTDNQAPIAQFHYPAASVRIYQIPGDTTEPLLDLSAESAAAKMLKLGANAGCNRIIALWSCNEIRSIRSATENWSSRCYRLGYITALIAAENTDTKIHELYGDLCERSIRATFSALIYKVADCYNLNAKVVGLLLNKSPSEDQLNELYQLGVNESRLMKTLTLANSSPQNIDDAQAVVTITNASSNPEVNINYSSLFQCVDKGYRMHLMYLKTSHSTNRRFTSFNSLYSDPYKASAFLFAFMQGSLNNCYDKIISKLEQISPTYKFSEYIDDMQREYEFSDEMARLFKSADLDSNTRMRLLTLAVEYKDLKCDRGFVSVDTRYHAPKQVINSANPSNKQAARTSSMRSDDNSGTAKRIKTNHQANSSLFGHFRLSSTASLRTVINQGASPRNNQMSAPNVPAAHNNSSELSTFYTRATTDLPFPDEDREVRSEHKLK